MKKIIFALMAIVLASCATQKRSFEESTSTIEDIIDFTKTYRSYLSDKEILDRKEASFLNKETIELLGISKTTKSVYFEKDFLIEGNWKKITLPAGTYGKAISVSPGRIVTRFSEKDTISFTWIEYGENYVLGVKQDPAPKIPPGFKQKYKFTSTYDYIEYMGGKFYILENKGVNELQVNRKILEPTEVELKGLKH